MFLVSSRLVSPPVVHTEPNRTDSIENMLLMQEKDFETPDGARAPMDVAEFYDALETKRMARLDGLVQQYNSIESLLIKVGGIDIYVS